MIVMNKPVVASDHPDFIGGIIWSKIEIDWINARDKEWSGSVEHWNNQFLAAAEANKQLSEQLAAMTRERDRACELGRKLGLQRAAEICDGPTVNQKMFSLLIRKEIGDER